MSAQGVTPSAGGPYRTPAAAPLPPRRSWWARLLARLRQRPQGPGRLAWAFYANETLRAQRGPFWFTLWHEPGEVVLVVADAWKHRVHRFRGLNAERAARRFADDMVEAFEWNTT